MKKYKPGGYAPVSIGEVLNARYRIIKKIGFGEFSTVFLCYDYNDTQNFKALKIAKSSKTFTEAAEDERNILSNINSKYCCKLHNSFTYTSPFGEHITLVFDIYGESLYSVMREYRHNGIPIKCVKSITIDLLKGLIDCLECNIINTDIKPENILIRSPTKEISNIIKKYVPPNIGDVIVNIPVTTKKKKRKKYDEDECSEENDEDFEKRISNVLFTDFGNGCSTEDPYKDYICTLPYRPPENIITKKFTASADVWSLGCTIYEMLTGSVLFDPDVYETGDKREVSDTHLASVIEITGGNPTIYKDGKRYNEYCRPDGTLRFIRNLKNISLKNKISSKIDISKRDAEKWANFIIYMLNFDHKERPTPQNIYDKYIDWLSS